MPYPSTLTIAHIIEEVAERLIPILTDAVNFIHGVSFRDYLTGLPKIRI